MRSYVRSLFVRDWRLKLVSLVLALGVWLLLVPAEKKFSEKSLTIPLETRNIPAGLEIVERPTTAIDVTLRAPNRLLDEIGPVGPGRPDRPRPGHASSNRNTRSTRR